MRCHLGDGQEMERWAFYVQKIQGCTQFGATPPTTATTITIHQPVFDIRNSERLPIEKLTHYYVMCQGAMNELQWRHKPEALAPYYETARDAWDTDSSNPKKSLQTHLPRIDRESSQGLLCNMRRQL